MNVLSLFDGISCGRVALERAGIKIDKYFASEIDKYAIQIAKKNYPDTIHIGDMKTICYGLGGLYHFGGEMSLTQIQEDVKIDLIIGGSPCQDLSIAKKGGKGLQGEKSSLFYEYVRLLKEVKPKYFLLENVASMKAEDKETITSVLKEVYPDTMVHTIDSSLLSAQNRLRHYWTNIPGVVMPEDKNIMLLDIIELGNPHKEISIKNRRVTKTGIAWDNSGKGYCSQQDRAYSIFGKHPCLPSSRLKTKVNWYINPEGKVYSLNWDEIEKLQTLPVGYTYLPMPEEQRGKAIGNGWTVDVIAHILSFLPR